MLAGELGTAGGWQMPSPGLVYSVCTGYFLQQTHCVQLLFMQISLSLLLYTPILMHVDTCVIAQQCVPYRRACNHSCTLSVALGLTPHFLCTLFQGLPRPHNFETC